MQIDEGGEQPAFPLWDWRSEGNGEWERERKDFGEEQCWHCASWPRWESTPPQAFFFLAFFSWALEEDFYASLLPPSTSSSLLVFLSFTVMIPPLPSQLCSFTSPVFCKGNPSSWRMLNAQKHLDNIIIMMSHHLSVSLYIYCLTFLIVAFFCEYCFFFKLSIIREISPNMFLFWLHLPFVVL